MDYFKQRRVYRKLKRDQIDISTGQNNLYRELLDYANDEGLLDRLFTLKNSALLDLTGLSEAGMKKARNELVQLGLISYFPGKRNREKPAYKIIQLYGTSWDTRNKKSSSTSSSGSSSTGSSGSSSTGSSKELTSTRPVLDLNSNKEIPKKTPVRKTDPVPYSAILDYLNKKAGTNYRASSKASQRLIHARWNDGFRLPDFQRVVDNKTASWGNDSRWSKYLRPETLFGTKFESYLNECTSQQKQEDLGW